MCLTTRSTYIHIHLHASLSALSSGNCHDTHGWCLSHSTDLMTFQKEKKKTNTLFVNSEQHRHTGVYVCMSMQHRVCIDSTQKHKSNSNASREQCQGWTRINIHIFDSLCECLVYLFHSCTRCTLHADTRTSLLDSIILLYYIILFSVSRLCYASSRFLIYSPLKL